MSMHKDSTKAKENQRIRVESESSQGLEASEIANTVEAEKKEEKKTILLSARRLLALEFPETEWVVQDILPEGSLSILSARPKAGKTFLAIQLAVAVALERSFLLKRTKKKNILFLSYELNQKQFQKRLRLVLKHFGIPPEKVASWDFRRFPLLLLFDSRFKGVDRLRSFLERFEREKNLKIELIFIDTYVLFKDFHQQAKKENKSMYELESEYLAKLRKLCEEKGITIVLIYHNRKRQAVSGDITEEVMGSTGITGAVNNLLLLERKTGSPEAYLRVTGHDVGEQDIELTFKDGFFKLRTMEDKEQEVVELVIGYLKQVGQANQSSILQYLKRKGYKSVRELTYILDKFSQENSSTQTYWYISKRKRDGGGTPLKLFSLTPPPELDMKQLFEGENEEEIRKELLERVERLLNEGVISSEFPEKLEEYGISDFASLVSKAEEIPLDVFVKFVEKLESYREEASIDDEEFNIDF